ncbi:MAG TPA: hypothetical protein DDZ84_02775 [Firmicutes bacterium]|jgi:hypothetical protein|nr:hypothetical protein [Bacillota bacterium]
MESLLIAVSGALAAYALMRRLTRPARCLCHPQSIDESCENSEGGRSGGTCSACGPCSACYTCPGCSRCPGSAPSAEEGGMLCSGE